MKIGEKLNLDLRFTLILREESSHGFKGFSGAYPHNGIDIIREYWGNSSSYARACCTLLLLRRMRFRYNQKLLAIEF